MLCRAATTSMELMKQADQPAANSCSGLVPPPGPPISLGGFRCTSTWPSSVTACPDRPPVAVARAVYSGLTSGVVIPAATARPARASRAAGRTAAAAGGAAAGAELTAEAAGIFERLRAWRTAASKEQGVPAYVIFHDATMRQIAAQSPGSLDELSGISGVGEAKLAKYGQQILDVLAEGA